MKNTKKKYFVSDGYAYLENKKISTDALKNYRRYQNRYVKENYRTYVFRFNKKTEANLVSFLDNKDNLSSYIRRLITEDMKKS